MPATATAQATEVALTARGEAYVAWAKSLEAEEAAAALRTTLVKHGASFPFTLRPTEDGYRVEADHTAEPGKLSNLDILGQMLGYLGFNRTWERGGFTAWMGAPTRYDPAIARAHMGAADRAWEAAQGEAG